MAINLLDMLKDQISDKMLSQAGSFLGANEAGVKSAMGAALPSVLGSMISNTSTPSGAKGMMDMITRGNFDGSMLNNMGGILGGGDATSGFLNQGSGILKSLMGNKLGSVVDIISSVSGLNKGSSSSIMSMAAPLVMSMVGKMVKNKAMDALGLGKFLGSQSKHVANALPAGMGRLLGFSADSGMGDRMEKAVESTRETVATTTQSSSLLTRVLPLLLLLGVAFFGWQYFQNTDAGKEMSDGISNVGNTMSDAATSVTDKAGEMANDAGEGMKNAADKAGEMASDAMDATTKAAKDALASVKFATGSVGEKFNNFLSSDAADADATFKFNNLNFASGSANISEMTEVNNLAAVLKAYPNVNIEVGGHTDSSGNAVKNMTLSQQRADAVKAQLVAQGITADRISTKGYGSTMPTTANAAEAANRRVEIKVTK